MRKMILTGAALLAMTAFASAEPLGQFTDHQDIGKPRHPGSARYDAKAGSYSITGGGQNMWAARDDFHYAWKQMSGDVRVTVDLKFTSPAPKPGDPGVLHRKGGIVLMHEIHPNTLAHLDTLIERLLAEGFRFAPLTDPAFQPSLH